MHFSSIEVYNFGIYKGIHTINLLDQQGQRNITLIGGMNGRGKTTLLDSIFLCLYGRKAVEFVVGKKEAYNKVLRDRINKSSADQSTYITLKMALDDDAGTLISVTRSWRQQGGKIKPDLSVEKNGIVDTYLSNNWDYYVEELIPFGIAKFFFFDNEKISQIADDDAFNKVKDSIKSLMGVSTVESLCAHIEKIRKSKNISIKKAGVTVYAKESEELSIEIEKTELKIQALYTQKAGLVPQQEKTSVLLEQAEDEFWKKGGNLGLDHDAIIKDRQELRNRAEKNRESALALAAGPATPLCLCKELVVETYNSIKAGEESRAKHFSLPIISKMYDNLLLSYSAVYPHSSGAYRKLSEMIHDQLAVLENEADSERSAVITPLAQTLIEKFVSVDANLISDKATEIISENRKVLTALAQLEVHLSSNAEKNATMQLLKRIKELQAQKTQYEADIARCEEQIRSAKNERDLLKGRLDKILLKIAAEADTSDDDIRIIEYSTLTLEVMKEFTKRLQAQKVEHLENNIRSCFDFLAQKQGIITSISIDPETLDITLKDYKGGVLLKEQLSAGEKQMFAISILWGLALTSGYKLPVVIDTPMGRLDSVHRSNFINKYLPNASSQVIVLSTDEEIHGKYLDDIRDHVIATFTLVYDENEKCSSIDSGYFGGTLS